MYVCILHNAPKKFSDMYLHGAITYKQSNRNDLRKDTIHVTFQSGSHLESHGEETFWSAHSHYNTQQKQQQQLVRPHQFVVVEECFV